MNNELYPGCAGSNSLFVGRESKETVQESISSLSSLIDLLKNTPENQQDDNPLTITISGKAATGKSSVGRLIEELLIQCGLNVSRHDTDHPNNYGLDLDHVIGGLSMLRKTQKPVRIEFNRVSCRVPQTPSFEKMEIKIKDLDVNKLVDEFLEQRKDQIHDSVIESLKRLSSSDSRLTT